MLYFFMLFSRQSSLARDTTLEHWSMGHVKMHEKQKQFEYDCKMEGAIIVSDRLIKQECIMRELFGLPSHMINLAEKIKAGMLLFLFEHEERKLYGVFEATSDGAMNIVPEAFHFSGKSFPAQVPFRRVWICRPLCEDEFCHAIDNHRSPKTFDFSLSYDQVFMLVQLFYLRKINITHNLNHIPNKIIRMFEKDYNNARKSSRNFLKTRNCHLNVHELQLHPNASLNAAISGWISACSKYDQSYPLWSENSPLPEDPVSNAISSNAADVSFERYDQTHPIGTSSIQESMHEKVINSLSACCMCNDTKINNLDMNTSKSVLYNESEETYPSIKSQSDAEIQRASVFSQLSVDPKTAIKRKSFSGSNNSIVMAEASKQSKNLDRNTRRRSTSMLLTEKRAINEYVTNNDSIIAEIRPNFQKVRETDGGTLSNHKKPERLSGEERNKSEYVSKHREDGEVVPHDESANILVHLQNNLPSKCSQNNDCIDEAMPTFKKISETDYGTLYDHRELELLTSEKGKKPDDGSKHVESETEAVPHDESDNIAIWPKNSWPSECSQSKVATNDTEKGYGSLMKKVTSKNLLWFLGKSKDA